MLNKQKVTDFKDRTVRLFRERPIEMLLVTAAVATATSKVVNSLNETANAVTWRREVNRRNRNSMH